jgi:hypothetical protein
MYLSIKYPPKITYSLTPKHPSCTPKTPILPFPHPITNKNRGKAVPFLVGANLAKSIDLAKKSKKV